MQKTSSSQGLINTIPSRYSPSSGAIARYATVIIFGNSQIKYVDDHLMGFGTTLPFHLNPHIQTQYLYLSFKLNSSIVIEVVKNVFEKLTKSL